MKIVVLGTRGFPDVQGGVEKHCEELYPRLVALGCEVTVLSRAPYTGTVPYQFKGVEVLPVRCPRHKFLEAPLHTFRGLLKARTLNPDVVHIHAIGPSLFVPMARLLNMKVIITHHGPDYERKKWSAKAKRILRLGEEWGVMFSHQVIAISNAIADSILKKFGREVPVIPNGVVVNTRLGEEEILKRYELEPDNYILAVGRLVPEKGFHDLVESFRQFVEMKQAERDRLKLVIVGDCDHEDEYSSDFKNRNRDIPDVVMTGFQSGRSLQELYSHAGLFVLPSFHEGLPIALLEALSYGSSCLVSDIPANREVGLEEERYFPPGDVNRLAQKIGELLDLSDTEDDRQKRIDQIVEKYDWARIARETLAIYREVLDR